MQPINQSNILNQLQKKITPLLLQNILASKQITKQNASFIILFNSVPAKHHSKLKQILQSAIITYQSTQNIIHTFTRFLRFSQILKQQQISRLVIQIVYSVYKQCLINKKQQMPGQYWYSSWTKIPLSCIQDYITSFNLQKFIQNEHKQNIHKIVNCFLLDNKIKQAITYYLLYPNRDINFQMMTILPKLKNTPQLYSPIVIKLLQSSPTLLQQLIKSLDPHASIKLLQTANLRVTEHPTLIQYLQKNTYNHFVKQFKVWYKIQQRLSFNKKFIEWYAKQIEDQGIRNGILFRLGKINQVEGIKMTENPLFIYDQFTYTEKILYENFLPQIQQNSSVNLEKQDKEETIVTKKNNSQKQQKKINYWQLVKQGINQQYLHFIDSTQTQKFQSSIKKLFYNNFIGFDCEFKANSHKYQEDGASIMQLSLQKQIFIFDILKLRTDVNFTTFVLQLFYNPSILKIGHTIKSDIGQLSKAFNLDKSKCKGFVDLCDLFKSKFPNSIQSSLSYITKTLTLKQLSKYQQRSNWNRRPLRKCQLHYAGLDAYICLINFKLLSQQSVYIKQMDNLLVSQRKNVIKSDQYIVHQNFSYGIQYKHFMEKPKFLVDNMIKKLSSYLRNLGIDAQFIYQKDTARSIAIAMAHQRIIVTKDKSLKSHKNIRVPVYLINSSDAQSMAKEIIQFFNIDLKTLQTLSRCVKCNSDELIIIDPEEALKVLNFKHENNAIKQYWVCKKCNQIYWEGGQFIKAKKKFEGFK